MYSTKQNKTNAINYLIKQGVLNSGPCVKDIVYFVNTAVMEDNLNVLKLLTKHIDISKYFLREETNPSVVNRTLDYGSYKILDFLLKTKIIQPYFLTKETSDFLSKSNTENKFKNYFINKIIINFKLKNNKKYIINEEQPGDIAVLFKVLEYDILDKELDRKVATCVGRLCMTD